MAEPTDRGITINLTLAWTMLVSVAGLIWWGGGTLASLQGAAERLTAALTPAASQTCVLTGTGIKPSDPGSAAPMPRDHSCR